MGRTLESQLGLFAEDVALLRAFFVDGAQDRGPGQMFPFAVSADIYIFSSEQPSAFAAAGKDIDVTLGASS